MLKTYIQKRIDKMAIESGYSPDEIVQTNRQPFRFNNYFDPVSASLAFIAVAGTAYGVEQSRQSASQQKDANDLRQNTQLAADAEMRRQKQRELRVRQAQMEQYANGTGGIGGSGVAGGESSLTTQTASSFAAQSSQELSANLIGDKLQGAADSASAASMGFQVASLAGSVFSITQKPNVKNKTPTPSGPQPTVDGADIGY